MFGKLFGLFWKHHFKVKLPSPLGNFKRLGNLCCCVMWSHWSAGCIISFRTKSIWQQRQQRLQQWLQRRCLINGSDLWHVVVRCQRRRRRRRRRWRGGGKLINSNSSKTRLWKFQEKFVEIGGAFSPTPFLPSLSLSLSLSLSVTLTHTLSHNHGTLSLSLSHNHDTLHLTSLQIRFSILPYTNSGPIPGSFVNFVLFSLQFQEYKLKKRRWCAWDLNPGPPYGRCIWNHGAMAAALSLTLSMTNIFNRTIMHSSSM